MAVARRSPETYLFNQHHPQVAATPGDLFFPRLVNNPPFFDT